MKHVISFFYLSILAITVPAFASTEPANHQLKVTITDKFAIEVRDTLTLYPDTKEDTISLLLRDDYQVLTSTIAEKSLTHQGFKISSKKSAQSIPGVPIREYDITKPKNIPWPQVVTVLFHYKGSVYDPTEKETGIQLSGASYFYPQFLNDAEPRLLTFTLTVSTPSDWTVVSQGRLDVEMSTSETAQTSPKNSEPKSSAFSPIPSQRHPSKLARKQALESKSALRPSNQKSIKTVNWKSLEPQEEIFLIADRFEKYEATHGTIQLYAFLRSKDQALADMYLKAAGNYIDFYEKLLSPYPYTKFALVENARQTGFGMPSFTLLGSQVILFPFILQTSYPHEILHNWWGNGVFIHPRSGNWAEGLTSYLSDHLMAEIEGQSDKYRFQELMKYSNYVSTMKDFPLTDFKSRQDMASQAVGYGKWLMVLNMLRVELGDDVFLRSLQDFYNSNKFRFAGYNNVQASFEKVSGKNLNSFFQQWIKASGAPVIELVDTSYESPTLQIKIKQTGTFRLTLPVAVWFEDNETPQLSTLTIGEGEQTFNLELPSEPAAIMLDPYYDVFRKLDRQETPPSISQTYGADKIVTLLEEKDLIDYRSFAQSLTGQEEGNSLGQGDIPLGHSVWIFGKSNAMANEVIAQLKLYGVQITDTDLRIEDKSYPWVNNSFVFTVRNPNDIQTSMTWVVTDLPESIPGLIRKLPHYGKYGYLVFEGPQPVNILKGTWPADRIGMMKTFHQGKFSLPPKPPLVNFKPVQ